jgi:hypothetical protein
MRIFKVANKYFDRCQYIKTLSLPIYDIRKYIYPERGVLDEPCRLVNCVLSCTSQFQFSTDTMQPTCLSAEKASNDWP